MNRPQLEQLIRDSLTQSPETHVHMLAARIRELEAQVAHDIPADRVLGDGEIKGTPEELAKIAEEAGWKWIRAPIESKKALVDWMANALRANQGGAAT